MEEGTTDHSILLEHLSHTDTVLDSVITSYFRSRTFSVATNGSVSGALKVSYSVHPGIRSETFAFHV